MKYPFRNLVFRGGGVLGIAYAGSIEVLAEKGIYENIERVSGSSAGAITSLLVALKYDTKDIMKTLKETMFTNFMDHGNPLQVLSRYGYYRGEWALNWLKGLVKGSPLGLDENATYSDLMAASGRELYMFVTDINGHISQETSHRETPDVILAEAARASMSIPLFFEAFQFSQGLPSDHLYVDGGMVYNFPMSVFDEPKFLPEGQEDGVNPESLGFYFVQSKPDSVAEFGYDHIIKYLENSVDTLLATQNDDFKKNFADVERTVEVPDCGIRATQFDLTEKEQEELINSGRNSTISYLEKIGQ